MQVFPTVASFFGSVVLIPLVGQIQADSFLEKLAKGSTQTVLAAVVVSLAFALIRIFKLYRQDMRDENEKLQQCMKEHQEKLEKLIHENTLALNNNAKSMETLGHAVEELTRAVIGSRGHGQH